MGACDAGACVLPGGGGGAPGVRDGSARDARYNP